mgnify:CR=1 FL=1
MSVVVVTGTDTGVGKTVATAALACHARLAGVEVAVCKPLQTGSGPTLTEGDDDLAEVARLAGVAHVIRGWRYPEPLAPKAAAERAGTPLPTRAELRELVRSAAEHISDDDIDELERLVEEVTDAIERHDGEAVANAEFAFRRVVNLAAGRVKLAWFLLHATRYLPSRIYAEDAQWGRVALANHHDLIEAFRRRDADAAVRLTREQFTDGARRLTARLDELGLWT